MASQLGDPFEESDRRMVQDPGQRQDPAAVHRFGLDDFSRQEMSKFAESRPGRGDDPTIFPNGGSHRWMFAVRVQGRDQARHDRDEGLMLIEPREGTDVLFPAATTL